MLEIIPFGDTALIVKLGDDISTETNSSVRKLYHCMDVEKIHGVIELVPSYNELMVYYNPLLTDFNTLITEIRQLGNNMDDVMLPKPSLIKIPVHYGGTYGPDLKFVAQHNHLTEEEVIRIHSSADYLVYMMGFTPGFCYLGGMDARIATPRKGNPRLKIKAGSVGIADQQTGIYPIDSPGGWQLIGQTALKLFDPKRTPVFLARAGDHIRFYPV